MATKQAESVLELVVFKLKEGVTPDQLLATVDAVTAWAQTQPGFISRDLTYSADEDKWIDLLWWESLTDAKAAAEAAMSSETCTPMFELIDFDSTVMLHGTRAKRERKRAA